MFFLTELLRITVPKIIETKLIYQLYLIKKDYLLIYNNIIIDCI